MSTWDYSFGNWLKRRRKALDLTQQELAQRVGCSLSLIFKIESDERRPSRQIAELLTEHLEIPNDQRALFLKVARQEKAIESLEALPSPSLPQFLDRPLAMPLPVPLTSLVGREPELQAILQQIQDPACRLFTLTGPGGVGKTRLSLEVAHRLRNHFEHGVYFVSLVSTSAPEFIIPAIADSLGFVFSGATALTTQLFHYVKDKQILLVLDNLEHLLDGSEVLSRLLEHAPQMKLLTTSREPLNLGAEWVFEVQGLPIPSELDMRDMVSNSASELFIQRAKQSKVDFILLPDDYSAVMRICRLVDGLPLGLELAASWNRMLSVTEIAYEIERNIDFLTTTARDAPHRHRSMRAVIEHSWNLLSEEERRMLRQIAVFRGGFTREAVKEVAKATLSVLSTLVNKSLVRRSGGGRYDLHELVRQFAAEQSANHPDEQATTQAYHARYYLTYFSQADERLRSSAQREVLVELTAEIDNFRAAWNWALTHFEFAVIEQTLRLFAWFYDSHGWSPEGLDMLSRAVDALETSQRGSPPDREHQVALAHLLTARSFSAYRLGRYEQAQAMLERSLEILRPLHEPRVLVESFFFLGLTMEVTGNYARAMELFTEGRETATAIGDRWFAAMFLISVNELIVVTHSLVKSEQTHERLQEAVADCRLIGDPRLTGFGLRIMSESAFAMGRYDEARAALDESVALSSSIGDRWGVSAAYRGLGVVAQAQGEHQQAELMFRKSLDTFTDLGGSWWMARVLADIGWSIFALGNDPGAEHVWREAIRIADEIHAIPVALEALSGLVSLRVKQGDSDHAFKLLLMILKHPASLQETQNRAEGLRSELEARLTPEQIGAAHAQAQKKSFDEIVEEALGL